MKRTLNYTGRKAINHDDARISLRTQPGGQTSFDAQLSLAEYELPPEAPVFIEAYRQTTWMRFPWGTAGDIQPPDTRNLSEFETPDEILFRVKVVSRQVQGRLIAEADCIRPCDPGDDDEARIPLLPVKPQDLGDEAWKVEFQSPVTRLLVNVSFGDVHSVARSPEFRALVYPAALRTILDRALCERYANGDLPSAGEPEEWQNRWIRFCKRLPGMDADLDPFDLEEVEQRQDWIDESVRAFCRREGLRDSLAGICRGGQ